MQPSPPKITLRIPDAHKGHIHSLAYNSTGRYVLSGGQDRSISLWNSTTGTLIKHYRAHGYEVLDIAVAHDDTKFASCGGDRTVFLWDVPSATTIARFPGHMSKVNSVAFNDQSTVLASGSDDATVAVWDCKSGSKRAIQILKDAKDSISSVGICDTEIIVGSVDGYTRVYDVRNCQLVSNMIGSPVTSVVLSHDKQCLLVSTLDSHIRLMDKSNGTLLQTYKGHANERYRFGSCFARNDTLVLSSSEDGYIYIWDFVSGEIMHRVSSPSKYRHDSAMLNTAYALAVSTDGNEFATSTLDGTVELWKFFD